MISNPLHIVKHLFQIALAKQFRLPITVDMGQRNSEPIVIMVEQTTLHEWTESNTSNLLPLWVEAKISIPNNVISDVETLVETYEEVYQIIQDKIDKGRLFNASSF
tara:strand:- start:632 stop:949 length:318 start_codon:yes stop_codon:yes gene_type:complete